MSAITKVIQTRCFGKRLLQDLFSHQVAACAQIGLLPAAASTAALVRLSRGEQGNKTVIRSVWLGCFCSTLDLNPFLLQPSLT